MKIYEYNSYDEYVSEQTRANKIKLKNVWVDKSTIRQIADRVKNPKSIICHGTRNAAEQRFLKAEYPDAEIIGTEISETATQFEMTVQHDFHEQKEEWVGKFDILYSNSFDHAYDPWKCIRNWGDQLAPGGWMFLEIASDPDVNRSKSTDPLQIDSEQEVMDLLEHARVKYVNRFHNSKGSCTIYIARKE